MPKKTVKNKVKAETEKIGVPEDLLQKKLNAEALKIWANDYKKVASDDHILKMAKAEADKADLAKCLDAKDLNEKDVNLRDGGENYMDDETHKQKIAAILTMPSRVDQVVEIIGDLQIQIAEVQKKQSSLLDESTELFQELYAVKPRTEEELQLVVNTYIHIKQKFDGLFAIFMPNHIEMQERNQKNASVQQIPK